MRPLYDWPSWLLVVAAWGGVFSARVELWLREADDAADAACDDTRGPYRVAPPAGMH